MDVLVKSSLIAALIRLDDGLHFEVKPEHVTWRQPVNLDQVLLLHSSQ